MLYRRITLWMCLLQPRLLRGGSGPAAYAWPARLPF
jgi:hypothetical protein